MGRHTLEGNPPIEVTLRRSSRARRLSLRISRLDGRVTLTLPKSAREQDGVAFLKAREPWLRGHFEDISPQKPVVDGAVLLFAGEEITVLASKARRVVLENGVLLVSADRPVGPQVRAYLKSQARDRLAVACDAYAAVLGRAYTRLALRDTRSRWGSCSSNGTLMFSWRLIMAPPRVLNYVAAHEVAHLVEMNHSSQFWNVVEILDPEFRNNRKWLRDHGDLLHRVKFDD